MISPPNFFGSALGDSRDWLEEGKHLTGCFVNYSILNCGDRSRSVESVAE